MEPPVQKYPAWQDPVGVERPGGEKLALEMKLGARHSGAHLNPSSRVEGCKFEANCGYIVGSHLKTNKNKQKNKPNEVGPGEPTRIL